jgi:hypothetical protein
VATVSLTVTAVNDAPVNTVPAALSVNEDVSLLITGLAVADVDAGDGEIMVTLSVAHGTLNMLDGVTGGLTGGQISGDNTGAVTLTGTLAAINATLAAANAVEYQGHLNFNGTDTLTVLSSDEGFTGIGGAQSDTDSVAITVHAVNDAPVAVDDETSTEEEEALIIAVLANDTDVDGDTLEVSGFTQGAHGTVSANADGTLTYTPDADFHGTDSFEYEVSDGQLFDTGLVTITIDPVNDAPVAVDDSYSIDEDTVLSVAMPGVLGNDSDVDLDSLSAELLSDVSHGTLSFNADGSFSYAPELDFNGTDSFTYRVSDGLLSDTGLVTITIDPAGDNGAPVFTPLGPKSVAEGHELRFTVSATDPEAGTLTYSANGLPAGATFNPETREFFWIPADDAAVTMTFTVFDPDGATGTLQVAVTATNVAPTVDAGADQQAQIQGKRVTGESGRPRATVSIEAIFNDLGTLDTHEATIDWGDGTVTAGEVLEAPFGPPGSTAGANGIVTGTHFYVKTGIYTVTVTVVDDDGAARSDTLVVTVKRLTGKTDEGLESGVRLQLNELGFDGDPDAPVSDATLLNLALQAAEHEAASKHVTSPLRTGSPAAPLSFDFEPGQTTAGVIAIIDWQARFESFGISLSPFALPGTRLTNHFPDFLLRLTDSDESEEDAPLEANEYDALGRALGASVADKSDTDNQQ